MNPLDEPMQDMDNLPASPWPTILKYGFIGALALVVISTLSFVISAKSTSYATSAALSFVISGFNIILYVLLMGYSIKEYRDKHSGGFISLGKGMLVSYGSALIMAVVGLLFNLLYLLVINPNYMQDQISKSISDSGMSLDHTSSVSGFYTPMVVAGTQFVSFIMGCLVGIVVSLIISAIMKKDRPAFNRPN